MLAIAVASANDASMAVAEGLWGSKEQYLEACNKRAQELGMAQSLFHSVHGLPPSKGESFDLTSARDMAALGRACVRRPKILEWTSRRELVFRESDGVKASTNKLLGVVPGCDGIKTGFIRAAGFCITATAARDGVRVIAVVMGDTKRGRFESARDVLEQGLGMVTRVRPVTAGMTIGRAVPVTNGVAPAVSLMARDALETVVLKEDAGKLQLMVSAPSALEAPVSASAEVGGVKLVLGDRVLGETALVTASGTEAKTLWRRMMDKTGLSR
jgi:D-alanyl-D-alanine carboxypeptidase (penicillin-binding protein 5/6)